MGDYDDPALTGQVPARRGRLLAVGAAVAALVIGLAAGFVIGGGTSRESDVTTVETSVAPTPTPTPPASAASAQACLRAGDAGTEVLAQLDLAVQAIAEFDLGALRRILDRLQPLQGELEADVAACGVQVAPR